MIDRAASSLPSWAKMLLRRPRRRNGKDRRKLKPHVPRLAPVVDADRARLGAGDERRQEAGSSTIPQRLLGPPRGNRDHLFRYFSRKRNAQVPPRTWLLSRPFGQRVNPTHQYGEVGEDAEPLGRAASVIAPTLRTGIGQRSNVQIDLNSLQLSDRN
jgi:hypothetical protein